MKTTTGCQEQGHFYFSPEKRLCYTRAWYRHLFSSFAKLVTVVCEQFTKRKQDQQDQNKQCIMYKHVYFHFLHKFHQQWNKFLQKEWQKPCEYINVYTFCQFFGQVLYGEFCKASLVTWLFEVLVVVVVSIPIKCKLISGSFFGVVLKLDFYIISDMPCLLDIRMMRRMMLLHENRSKKKSIFPDAICILQ